LVPGLFVKEKWNCKEKGEKMALFMALSVLLTGSLF
jgi:hypothetical protein